MQLLYLNSDTLGQGEEKLGKKLLISFLNNLLSMDVKIDAVFCVNSAALLTTTNTEVVDILKKMAHKGAVISTCGTCLEYYNLKDQLQVGEIGSMSLAINLMQQADKIIRP